MPFEIAESQREPNTGTQFRQETNPSMLFADNRVLFDGISQLAGSDQLA